MIIHAIRKTYESQWYDDRDQFYQPYRNILGDEPTNLLFGDDVKFPLGYAYDCVVWSLFSFESNSTSAMADVKYKGKVYQIKNHLFPFTIQQVNDWRIEDMDIASTILTEKKDRFAASWLQEHREELSTEARNVLKAASKVYKIYFQNLNSVNTAKFKIRTWDAGLYQIRFGLKEADLGVSELTTLSEANNILAEKIRSRVRELGFMR